MSEKIDYSKGIYDAHQLGAGRMFILGVQHMFAMFGATVLVPLLTGLSVSTTLLCAGLGTLLFHLSDGGVLESTGSMDELARQLAPYEIFLRPHRSFLVNMEYVQSISSRAVTLTNLVQIPIPHGKSSDIRRQYLEYAFRRKQVML